MDDDEPLAPTGLRPEVADAWAAVLIDVHEKRKRQKDDEPGQDGKRLPPQPQP